MTGTIKIMPKHEKVKKNIGLAFDLLMEIIKNPAMTDNIPDGSTIIFLDNEQSISKKETLKNNNKYINVKRQFEVV
ncbi:MAG: hypothetical protein HY738_23160 [Bacteroidia bacterium]|nr:hypothetical protein [Bacteroidia bacterium]